MASFSPFSCPPGTALTNIPDNSCPVVWDQIVKMFIFRKGASAPFTVPPASSPTIQTKTNWTTLLTATDNTKVLATPEFSGLVIPKTTKKEEGKGDNSTIDGIGYVVSADPVDLTCIFQNKSATVKDALLKLMSEGNSLQAYFVNRFDQIITKSDGSGIDLYNLFVSDFGSEGYAKRNEFDLSFTLRYGWSFGMADPIGASFSFRSLVNA